jgi:tyrosyl-tRNA synthetase
MSKLRSEFLTVLTERGYIHQCSDLEGLDTKAAEGVVTAYVGYDATADSLHVGSLVSIMMLRWMQKTGHRPIVLMGGGTTKVGDPSGKDESRQLLSVEQIDANIANIRTIFENFVEFGDGPTGAVMANNADWLDELQYIPFLREVGRHFTINRMLTFDSVKLRLDREQPLTFLEFNYMILQAYDFLELYKRYGCTLQMGGSDQWGNIINGIDLTRRAEGGELYALTTPLITTASGAKMGKTAQGAVWLNEARLSHNDYWQFWRDTEDGDVGRFLKLFTELSLDEIAHLEKLEGAEINEAKKILANEATKLCRGETATIEAAATAASVFEQRGTGYVVTGMKDTSGSPRLRTALSVYAIPRSELELGIPAFALFRRVNLAPSGSAARKLINGGGGRLNDKAIPVPERLITTKDLNIDGVIKLSAGKKRHVLIRIDTELESANAWFDASLQRWGNLAGENAATDPAPLPHGHCAIGYQFFDDDLEEDQFAKLFEDIQSSRSTYRNTRSIFVPSPQTIEPHLFHGALECWVGRDEEIHDPSFAKFWRVSPDAQFFLIRGYQEDGVDFSPSQPGEVFDLTLSVHRLGEVLRDAIATARQLQSARILLVTEWAGLKGRKLVSNANKRRMLPREYFCHQDTFRKAITINSSEDKENLGENITSIIGPLLKLFDLFEIPTNLVEEELSRA